MASLKSSSLLSASGDKAIAARMLPEKGVVENNLSPVVVNVTEDEV